jgi:ribosomal-protein-alanine N-acetyltransferase
VIQPQFPKVSIAETPRLRLRLLSLEDAPFILELYSDPDFVRNVGDRGVHSLDDARRYLESGLVASYAKYGFGLYLVELTSLGTPIGLCGLLRRDSHEDVEIGFAMLPGFRGQGYTVEAARAALDLGLNALGLTRIVAIAAPANFASAHILERLGMKYERRVFFTAGGGESSLFVLDTRSAPGVTPR